MNSRHSRAAGHITDTPASAPDLAVTIRGVQGSGKSRLATRIADMMRLEGKVTHVLEEGGHVFKFGSGPPEVVITTTQDAVEVARNVRDALGDLPPGTVLRSEPRTFAAYPTSREISKLQAEIHRGNVEAGWWPNGVAARNVGELLILVTSEIMEAAEGVAGNLMDDKLPHRLMIEVELADTAIRIYDIAGAHGLDLAGAFYELLDFGYENTWSRFASANDNLLLIAREVSGAMEGDRKKSMDGLLTNRRAFEVRLAAALLGIYRLGHILGLHVGDAIVEKRAFNLTRADHQLEARKAAGGKAY